MTAPRWFYAVAAVALVALGAWAIRYTFWPPASWVVVSGQDTSGLIVMDQRTGRVCIVTYKAVVEGGQSYCRLADALKQP